MAAGLTAFAASHGLSLVILLLGWRWQRLQPVEPRFVEASFKEFLSSWDGVWYRKVVTDGYPASLPTDLSGEVVENTWAFFPGFPMLVRGISTVLGSDEVWTGVVVNQVAALGCAVVLVDIAHRLGLARDARVVVAAMFMLPAGPVLWMFYSEALFILASLIVLDFLLAERHWWAVAATPLAVVTRSVGVAVAATVLVITVHRAWVRWRAGSATAESTLLPLAAGALAGGAFLFWPVTAALVTGEWNALQATYAAWGQGPSFGLTWLPFFWTTYQFIGVMAVMVAATALWLARDRIGHVMVTHSVIYLLVLVSVSSPGSSTVRHLLPLIALPLALRPTAALPALMAMAVVAKFWWVFVLVVWNGTPGAAP